MGVRPLVVAGRVCRLAPLWSACCQQYMVGITAYPLRECKNKTVLERVRETRETEEKTTRTKSADHDAEMCIPHIELPCPPPPCSFWSNQNRKIICTNKKGACSRSHYYLYTVVFLKSLPRIYFQGKSSHSRWLASIRPSHLNGVLVEAEREGLEEAGEVAEDLLVLESEVEQDHVVDVVVRQEVEERAARSWPATAKAKEKAKAKKAAATKRAGWVGTRWQGRGTQDTTEICTAHDTR